MTKTGNDLVHRLLCAAQGEPAGPVPGVHIQTLLREATDEIERLQIALNPRRWTREMSAAWHRAIPDTQAAFDALRRPSDDPPATDSSLGEQR